ncbi:hypothetical protein ACFLQN_00965 [Candidatus Aenigmatarchaeota archaeon]
MKGMKWWHYVIIVIAILFVIYQTIMYTQALVFLGYSNEIMAETEQMIRDSFYLNKAYDTEKSFHCDKISDIGLKDRCYSNVAILTSSSGLCIKINDDDIRSECYDAISGDFSFCKNDDQCYSRMAVLKENISICSNSGDWWGECVIKIAWNKHDASICYNKLSGDQDFLNWCLAGAKSDSYYCGSIVNRELGDECYSWYVHTVEPDYFICENIISEKEKGDCYTDVAKQTLSKVPCLYLSDSDPLNSKKYCEWAVDLYSFIE